MEQRLDGAGAARQRALSDIPAAECLRLLTQRYVGRLAFLADGRPALVPVNYVFAGGFVHFRTGTGGRLDGLAGQPVAFEIDAVDLDYHQGWSVVVEGVAEALTDPAALEEARRLPLRPWAPGDRSQHFRISEPRVSGRRIT